VEAHLVVFEPHYLDGRISRTMAAPSIPAL
jgi:hypothetical protein